MSGVDERESWRKIYRGDPREKKEVEEIDEEI